MEERPIESVLRGDFDVFKEHLYQVASQSWPGMPVFVYDSSKTNLSVSSLLERIEIDGDSVAINWPRQDTSSYGVEDRALSLARELGERQGLPATFDAGEMARNFISLDMLYRNNSEEGARRVEAMLAPLPVAFGAAARFNLKADAPAGGAEQGQKISDDIGTLGVDSDICAHCQAASGAMLPHHCDPADPQQVRLQQLTRLYTGYHELAHVGDGYTGAVSEVLGGAEDITRSVQQNARESLADSYATLMFVKNLGEEGAAYSRLWASVRSNMLGSADHRTVATLKSTLEWAEAHPEQLAGMSPVEMFSKAKALTVTTSQRDLEQFDNYRQSLFDPQARHVEDDVSHAEVLRSPAQIAARLQQSDEQRLFGSEGRGVLPDNIVAQERLSHWAENGREKALSDLQRLNPLATPDWAAQEAERAAQCRVEVDAAKIKIAREMLDRIKAWDAENPPSADDPAAAEAPAAQPAAPRSDLLMPRPKSP